MLRTLIVFAIMIPGLGAALVNRFAALQLYVWFALFRPQEWVWFDISRLRLSLLTGALLVLPSLATGVLPNLSHPLSLGTLGFLLAGLLSALNATQPSIAWAWVGFFVRLTLVCLLLVTIVTNQRRFQMLVAVVAGSLGFHAAKAGLTTLIGGGVRFGDGLAGAWTDNNGYAIGMVMVMPFILATAQNAQNAWLKRAFAVMVPLTILSVISTFSRSGFLALCTCTLALVLLQRRRLSAAIVLAILSVPLAVFMISQEGYLDRLHTITSYEEKNETSAISRLHFWRVALTMSAAHPLGVGYFNFEPTYDAFDTTFGQYGSRRSVHNSHLQALTEAGVLGAATWGFLFVYAFRCAFRIRRRGSRCDLKDEERRLFTTYGNALIASMAAFIVGGSFIAMMLNDLTWLTFGMAASLDRISKASIEVTGRVSAASSSELVATPLPAAGSMAWVPTVAPRRPKAAARRLIRI